MHVGLARRIPPQFAYRRYDTIRSLRRDERAIARSIDVRKTDDAVEVPVR